ncbi:MAG: response regulator [Nitrospinae bacterium]|nr:response regulator [Nitrospinota bacterium]
MSPKSRILIVDDEVKTCSILKKYFKGLFEVDVACDGQQALLKVEEHQPDCILLDFKVPVLDGLDGIKLIKPKYPNVEIIMVSAFAELDIFAKCFLEGA